MGEPGGAILYAALAAACWETRVGCVSCRVIEAPGVARLLEDDAPGAVGLAGLG
jgi:hypothetical protein